MSKLNAKTLSPCSRYFDLAVRADESLKSCNGNFIFIIKKHWKTPISKGGIQPQGKGRKNGCTVVMYSNESTGDWSSFCLLKAMRIKKYSKHSVFSHKASVNANMVIFNPLFVILKAVREKLWRIFSVGNRVRNIFCCKQFILNVIVLDIFVKNQFGGGVQPPSIEKFSKLIASYGFRFVIKEINVWYLIFFPKSHF